MGSFVQLSDAMISTHTLREEGDLRTWLQRPMPPAFQPTPSARRVTHHILCNSSDMAISTHTLREEGDALCHERD